MFAFTCYCEWKDQPLQLQPAPLTVIVIESMLDGL